jgi:hypothetical protein
MLISASIKPGAQVPIPSAAIWIACENDLRNSIINHSFLGLLNQLLLVKILLTPGLFSYPSHDNLIYRLAIHWALAHICCSIYITWFKLCQVLLKKLSVYLLVIIRSVH